MEIGVQTAKARCTKMGAGAGLRSRLASALQELRLSPAVGAVAPAAWSAAVLRRFRFGRGTPPTVVNEGDRFTAPPPAPSSLPMSPSLPRRAWERGGEAIQPHRQRDPFLVTLRFERYDFFFSAFFAFFASLRAFASAASNGS